jgi:integrase/recombinase XerC
MKHISAREQQSAVPHRFPTPPSSAEITSLLAAASEEPKAADIGDVVTFLLDTGMRRKELSELRWSDVDFEARRITIRQPATSQRHYRCVPITRKTAHILAARHKRESESTYVLGKNPEVTLRRVTMHLKNISARLGIPTITLHALRHAFAARWCYSGGDPFLLPNIMGYRSFNSIVRFVPSVPASERLELASGH